MIKKECNIAVVGNMSAGKSTFINAMFGEDILPSSNHATTDCPIYIYSDDESTNYMAIISFHNTKETKGLAKQTLQKELKKYARHDNLVEEEQYKQVKRIDLYWRFYYFVNSLSAKKYYVIIDTPGPNNSNEFSKQHFLTTQSIIMGNASKLIYLLDYKQLDANLEVTKNNLWGMIAKRKKINKKFEVLFIINKIDEALKDNAKIPEVVASKTKEEYIQNIKKFWNFHEKKAIKKVKKIALQVGFEKPLVKTVSAEYIKLDRMKELSWDDKDKLEMFQNKFKNIFDKKWKHKYHQYIGSKVNIFYF